MTRQPGLPTGDKAESFVSTREGWWWHLGDTSPAPRPRGCVPQSPSNAGEPQELSSRVPLRSNLRSRRSPCFNFHSLPHIQERNAQQLPAPEPHAAPRCRSGAITDCEAALEVPDATEEALQQMPDTRLGDKKHFSLSEKSVPPCLLGSSQGLAFRSAGQPCISSAPRGAARLFPPPLLLLRLFYKR